MSGQIIKSIKYIIGQSITIINRKIKESKLTQNPSLGYIATLDNEARIFPKLNGK